MKNTLPFLVLILTGSVAIAQTESSIRYLANEAVMVTDDETKVLFDPLFQNSYDQYQLVPDAVREAIFSGTAPYDGIDSIFVSHHHGDHFTAEDMLRLLRAQSSVRLYAPTQAVSALREISSTEDESIFARVTGLDLEYGDAPIRIQAGKVLVEAVYIPHSGWPTARTDIQNIAFKITLNDTKTVLHMGDADARIVHFEADEEYWEERRIDLALPPYWFFATEDGREILQDHINTKHSIGVHAPARFSNPSEIPDELAGFEIFTQPGEGRRL